MLLKIISGGQTGADQAGLRAARRVGVATGGWAPRGWKTLDGAAPWLADYGLTEHEGDYAARTDANVRDSDATVRIARDWLSPGERCTLKAIKKYKKPHFDVPVDGGVPEFVRFLVDHNVNVLNVAGNSERTHIGIGALAEKFLVEALTAVRK